MSKKTVLGEMALTYEIAEKYSKNWSMTQIKRELGLHQEEVRRHIRKALKWFVENYQRSPEEKEGETVNRGDCAP